MRLTKGIKLTAQIAISSSALCFASGTDTFADSLCGYDAGLIGTKAIGYVSPSILTDAFLDLDTHNCFVQNYQSLATDSQRNPTKSAIRTDACDDFVHMPSVYIDEYAGDETSPASSPLAKSEYFALLVYDTVEGMAQISLTSGEKRWVKIPNGHTFPYHYTEGQERVSISHTTPTQSGIYTQPSLTAADPIRGTFDRMNYDAVFSGKKQRSFFRHPFFTELASKGRIDLDDGLADYARDPRSEFAIVYRVRSILKDDKGREWLRAEEHFRQNTEAFQWNSESAEINDWFDGRILLSAPLRTVYFPYREPSGTIVMVMIEGGYCD